MHRHVITTLTALLLAVFSLPAFADDQDIQIETLPYPVRIDIAAGHMKGARCFESDFSRLPSAPFDTVLVQGLIPDGLRLDMALKADGAAEPARYEPVLFRRFPNGRFWAKYTLPSAVRRQLAFSVVNAGTREAGTITIYGTELLKAALSREGAEQAQAFVYTPDPALSVPAAVPFKLVRRADWNAAPPKEPFTPHKPGFFTLHHTQWHYPATYDDAVTEMRLIQDFHQNGRGWIDIGYHFLIDPAGNIFEGRPIGVVGAHTKNKNTGNVGISIMGSYHPPVHDVFTPATEKSFAAVGSYIKDTYTVNVSSFYAHRDLQKDTDCPGDDLYAKKGELRDLIFAPKPAPELPADIPLLPAQRRALSLLLSSIEASPQ